MAPAKQKLIAGIICGIVAAALGIFFLEFKIGNGIENASYDLLFSTRPDIRPAQAVVVYMDPESHENLQQPLGAAWDRNLHARLVQRLTNARAKAIVFDIVFSGAGPNPEATTNFANAIKANGAVVLGVDIDHSAAGRVGIGAKQVIPPFDAFIGTAAGSERNTTIQQSYQRGANTFLRKPCKSDDLRALIQTFPGHWETHTAG